MGDYEAHIKTKFGSLVIHFTDKADLEKKLQDVNTLVQTIEGQSSSVVLVKDEDIPGLEGIAVMSSAGLPRIIAYPETDADKIRLALYASRNGLTSEEITRVTGVRNPTANRVMKFDEVNNNRGTYSLSGTGRTTFTSKVLPELRKKLHPSTVSE